MILPTKKPIQSLEPLIRFFCAADIEEFTLFGQHDGCLRNHSRQGLSVIESQSERLWWALFGVGGKFVFQVATKCCDETTRCCHRPPRLDSGHLSRHRSTAGVACDTNVPRVDFLTSQQVIQCSHSVPDSPGTEKNAD